MKLDRTAIQSEHDIQSIRRYVAHKRAEIMSWEPAPYPDKKEHTHHVRHHSS